MDSELLINYYRMGWELSENEDDFPKWFEFHSEKIACLLGFNDEEFKVSRSNSEIIEEIEKLIK